ncbi:hypothetical protein Btru_037614 [Bulinus truncatus]|nr:hypothetical protein Btru_037614 [Bulinus truncatus]
MKWLGVVFLYGLLGRLTAQDLTGILNGLTNMTSNSASSGADCEIQIATCTAIFIASIPTRTTSQAFLKCVDVVECYMDASLTQFKSNVINSIKAIITILSSDTSGQSASDTSGQSTGSNARLSFYHLTVCVAVTVMVLRQKVTSS